MNLLKVVSAFIFNLMLDRPLYGVVYRINNCHNKLNAKSNCRNSVFFRMYYLIVFDWVNQRVLALTTWDLNQIMFKDCTFNVKPVVHLKNPILFLYAEIIISGPENAVSTGYEINSLRNYITIMTEIFWCHFVSFTQPIKGKLSK